MITCLGREFDYKWINVDKRGGGTDLKPQISSLNNYVNNDITY